MSSSWAEESSGLRRGAHSDSWWQHMQAERKETSHRERRGTGLGRVESEDEGRKTEELGYSDVQIFGQSDIERGGRETGATVGR